MKGRDHGEAMFDAREIRSFKLYAIEVAAIAVAVFLVAPRGMGQVIGVTFALSLVPVPPIVIYLFRRRRVVVRA
jgi:hypothetical protein